MWELTEVPNVPTGKEHTGDGHSERLAGHWQPGRFALAVHLLLPPLALHAGRCLVLLHSTDVGVVILGCQYSANGKMAVVNVCRSPSLTGAMVATRRISTISTKTSASCVGRAPGQAHLLVVGGLAPLQRFGQRDEALNAPQELHTVAGQSRLNGCFARPGLLALQRHPPSTRQETRGRTHNRNSIRMRKTPGDQGGSWARGAAH